MKTSVLFGSNELQKAMDQVCRYEPLGCGPFLTIFLRNIVDIRACNDGTIHHVQYACRYQQPEYIRIQTSFFALHPVEQRRRGRRPYSGNFHQHMNLAS